MKANKDRGTINVDKIENNSLFGIIDGIEYRFGLAEGIRKSDKRNVTNCGSWNYNDCWLAYGMKSTSDPYKDKYEYTGIYNESSKEIKIL